ncbi:MAG: type II toxin-antitoxin system RelE/ParE family toxin [Clostridiales bacterium]|jgi:plasmid stabilization system protein ParE|nr:type II toxin-antitoxin system RelE/ParE family toxin [Clostridiales bacterium]
MKNVLIINPQVYDDLKAIKDFISRDDPVQAEKVVGAILDAIENIADMPESGANLQNKLKQKTKYKYILTYRNYATLYYIGKDAIYITLVLNTARDLSALKLLAPKADKEKN